jgi:hypothetical protein
MAGSFDVLEREIVVYEEELMGYGNRVDPG